MYTYTWKKYLSVIRLLLKRAITAEQTVVLNRTDFEKTTKLKKPSCSFVIEIAKGRPVTITPSVVAKDLIEILQQDEVAGKLLRQHRFAISFDSDFTLHIKHIAVPEPQAE